jgi:carbonic anhydrase
MRIGIIIVSGLTFAASAGALASEQSHRWSYAGQTGPSHWAELDSKFAACATGKRQSPIDIRTHDVHGQRLPGLVFDYRSSPLHIIDNGHSIQVDLDPGSTLRIGDKSYSLVQFHFHHPSEERINGKSSEMVAHLVHRDADGKLAVVAILFDTGKANPTVDALWSHLPKQKEHEADFNDVRINPAALLPPNRAYFTYTGSLTTPPCSEDVRWIVMKSHSTLSKGEIATFAAHYPNDARPVQNLNGREILATN